MPVNEREETERILKLVSFMRLEHVRILLHHCGLVHTYEPAFLKHLSLLASHVHSLLENIGFIVAFKGPENRYWLHIQTLQTEND